MAESVVQIDQLDDAPADLVNAVFEAARDPANRDLR